MPIPNRLPGAAGRRIWSPRSLGNSASEVHRGVGKTGVVGVLRVGNSHRSIGCAPTWMRCQSSRPTVSTIARAMTGGCMPAAMTGTPPCCSARRAILAETRGFRWHDQFHLPAGGGGPWRRRRDDQGRAVRALPVRRGVRHAQPARSAGRQILDPDRRHDGGRCLFRHHGGGPRRWRRGARPESGIDPVLVAAHITAALQSIVARTSSRPTPRWLSVTQILGGDAYNVIRSRRCCAAPRGRSGARP